jgi:hypothetical protein
LRGLFLFINFKEGIRVKTIGVISSVVMYHLVLKRELFWKLIWRFRSHSAEGPTLRTRIFDINSVVPVLIGRERKRGGCCGRVDFKERRRLEEGEGGGCGGIWFEGRKLNKLARLSIIVEFLTDQQVSHCAPDQPFLPSLIRRLQRLNPPSLSLLKNSLRYFLL